MIILSILKLILSGIIALVIGKLISKLKLPSILGWLIAGMIVGPNAINLMDNNILHAEWYHMLMNVLECSVGLMIGTELVWSQLKKSGKSIMTITLTQSIGTFILVSIVFGIIFKFMGIPVYIAFIFGGIALATAPAPALSIVKEFKTDGPVTKTLIPLAALDDMVGVVVFFTTITIIAGHASGQKLPAYMIIVVLLLPFIIGAITGIPTGFLLKKVKSKQSILIVLIGMILVTAALGIFINTQVLPKPILNFMLIGMAFSAAFSNMVKHEKLEEIMAEFNPILMVCMIFVILNLGAPLDYRLIMGAGLFTAVYIISRAAGKYLGAAFGGKITNSPATIKKYLGLTLLPHSGVSLVFTGIAVNVLTKFDPGNVSIIQGTIAAAAVINEVIAVIIAKKAFEWAGEFNKAK